MIAQQQPHRNGHGDMVIVIIIIIRRSNSSRRRRRKLWLYLNDNCTHVAVFFFFVVPHSVGWLTIVIRPRYVSAHANRCPVSTAKRGVGRRFHCVVYVVYSENWDRRPHIRNIILNVHSSFLIDSDCSDCGLQLFGAFQPAAVTGVGLYGTYPTTEHSILSSMSKTNHDDDDRVRSTWSLIFPLIGHVNNNLHTLSSSYSSSGAYVTRVPALLPLLPTYKLAYMKDE